MPVKKKLPEIDLEPKRKPRSPAQIAHVKKMHERRAEQIALQKEGKLPEVNKGGRPKEKVSLTEDLRNYLKENPQKRKAIITALVNKATDLKFPSLDAIQEIINRIDGKPTEKHEIIDKTPMKVIFMPFPGMSQTTTNEIGSGQTRQIVEGEVKELPSGERDSGAELAGEGHREAVKTRK